MEHFYYILDTRTLHTENKKRVNVWNFQAFYFHVYARVYDMYLFE